MGVKKNSKQNFTMSEYINFNDNTCLLQDDVHEPNT